MQSLSKEITITVATPTRHGHDTGAIHLAQISFLESFGGFTLVRGTGAYTFNCGATCIEENAIFTIGTGKGSDANLNIVTEFAKYYCNIASQESIYYKDSDGDTWLVFASGVRCSL